MKLFSTFVCIVCLCGCAALHKRSQSAFDEYDAVKIDQMVGNHVSGKVFERTLLCLNARRETRKAPAMTNQVVTLVTNVTLATVTNQTVTVSTNQSQTMATNLVAFPVTAQGGTAATNEPAAVETNQVILGSPQPSGSTNQSVSTAHNFTLSKASHQTVATANSQLLLSRQITVATNNLSITTADNQAVSAETNLVLTTVTNLSINAVTNQVVTPTNLVLRDYYLYIELTPLPDFVAQSGESLVLLVDGVRHGFSQTNSQTAFVSRKGFTSYLYKVPAEVLVDMANAKEVRVRMKGVNTVIEKRMNDRSRNRFRSFVLKYFVPETPSSPAQRRARAERTISQPGS